MKKKRTKGKKHGGPFFLAHFFFFFPSKQRFFAFREPNGNAGCVGLPQSKKEGGGRKVFTSVHVKVLPFFLCVVLALFSRLRLFSEPSFWEGRPRGFAGSVFPSPMIKCTSTLYTRDVTLSRVRVDPFSFFGRSRSVRNHRKLETWAPRARARGTCAGTRHTHQHWAISEGRGGRAAQPGRGAKRTKNKGVILVCRYLLRGFANGLAVPFGLLYHLFANVFAQADLFPR